MKAKILLDCLKNIVLSADTPVEDCNVEEGIRFLYPLPDKPVPGIVFAGTLSEWNMLNSMNRVCPQCTYLICTDGEMQPPAAPVDSYNLFFLNSSVKTLLLKLTFLLSSHILPSEIQPNQTYADFWKAIMDESIKDRPQAMAYIRQFPHQMHTYVACIVVSPDSTEYNIFRIQEITAALRDFFKYTNLFYENGEWIILYSQEKATTVELDISYDAFSQLLDQYCLNAGISYACQLPEQYRILYLTASSSVKLGRDMKLEPCTKRIYTYYQYHPYYMIQLCSQKYVEVYHTRNLVYLAHPYAVRLYYYDLKNNSNLLDVLITYLSYAQNLSLTAQALYMHRNTVMNKLNKIENILHHKPFTEKDQLSILLSCMILKYQSTQDDTTDFFP